MTSAALLLITLVMYRGQLVWLAMVIARFTASASTWGTEAGQGHPTAPQAPSEITDPALPENREC